ncbi:unnamed protein product [Rhizophagus irregularis]|uniref:Uncharacterized protein n=1 Tax=Rhizophagus irregularis TaxID=588596 RepID=A0A915ZTE6_9GLOM|nr:unnamed protein product [Rhizophagus irregularis]CAB5390184.1 unnamed protein product [Rhizophagus irregularis]
MVGSSAEASGIAKMVIAVSCAKVPQLTVIIGVVNGRRKIQEAESSQISIKCYTPIEKTRFDIFNISFGSWMLGHEISVTSSLDLWTCEILISNFEL